MKNKIGIIRVMSLSDDSIQAMKSKWEGIYPDMEIYTICLENQPLGVYDEKSLAAAEPEVVKAAISLEEIGCRAVLVNCAADPGVRKSRKKVRIPVIGAGSAAAMVVKAMDRKVGVIGITQMRVDAAEDILEDLMISRPVVPRNVKNARDLSGKEALEGIIDESRNLIKTGAQCILLACTAMNPLGIDLILRDNLGIPVIDPVSASMNIIEQAVCI